MRSRVPFLAAAGSDLDEVGDDTEVYTSGAELAQQKTPPKKEIVQPRTIVGYSPSSSFTEEDSFGYPTPVRTSTPTSARKFLPSRPQSTPTRGVSSADERYSSTTDFDSSSPQKRQAATRVRDVDPATLRLMEMRAETFLRLGLLGRTWSVWFEASDWITRTVKQIDTVRNDLLLRQYFAKWQDTTGRQVALQGVADAQYARHLELQAVSHWKRRLANRRLDQLEGRFVAHLDGNLARSAWRAWRTLAIKRRTARWEQDLKRRELAFSMRSNTQLVTKAFDAWHDRSREKQADRQLQRNTLKRTFDGWRRRASQSRYLARALAGWDRRQASEDLTECFHTWRKKTDQLASERIVIQRRDERLTQRVWSAWRLSATRHSRATVFNEQRLLGIGMNRLKAATQKRQIQLRIAIKTQADKEMTLLRQSFDLWVRLERGRLLHRVRDTRLLRTSLSKWQSKLAHVARLQAPAAAFAATSNLKSLHSTLSRWRDVLGRRRNAVLKADLVFAFRTKHNHLRKWRIAFDETLDQATTADKALSFFAGRKAFKVWQLALSKRRQDAFIEQRRLHLLRDAFNFWREATRQSIQDTARVEDFRTIQDTRMMSRTLSHWTERVVVIKMRELDVADRRAATLLAESFGRWRRAKRRNDDRKGLLRSFIDIQTAERTRRTFTTWLNKARGSRDRRIRLEFFEKDNSDRLLASTFAKWYTAKRERQLGPIEAEVALRHEDVLLFDVFDKWTARSQLLPAIQFDNKHLRNVAWTRWTKALDRSRGLKQAKAEHDKRLLADAFSVWQDALRNKMTKRPSHRTRRRLTNMDTVETLSFDADTPRPRRNIYAKQGGPTAP
ncbi:hypothetical protein Q8F55_000463 [Vanrija albida]|uniref:Sfi1 spindle body domain-containing protein n=1 Tax=Vanrija albida TaxID=181172 RepID=A0ABR3QDC9_9TREE